jgi:hypothetical protein
MAADLRNPGDQGRQMSRQLVVLAPKLDPQAVPISSRIAELKPWPI